MRYLVIASIMGFILAFGLGSMFAQDTSGIPSVSVPMPPQITASVPVLDLPVRDRQEPYTKPGEVNVLRDFFMSHQPAEWLDDKETCDLYETVYGPVARRILDRFGLVAENISPEFVAGTFYNHPDRAVRQLYTVRGLAANALAPLPDDIFAMTTYQRNRFLIAKLVESWSKAK
jgi:hypothetical protein